MKTLRTFILCSAACGFSACNLDYDASSVALASGTTHNSSTNVAGNDGGTSAGETDTGCQGEPDLQLCNTRGFVCGPAQITDRCDMARDLTCGACPSGAHCDSANHCKEDECRDGGDNDADSLIDCKDPDCDGEACSTNSRRCQNFMCPGN